MPKHNMNRKAIMIIILIWAASAMLLASASGYCLEIFGNANQDDTIDESDIAYARDVIAGKSPATELADANRDGIVDIEDIKQIQKIINSTEDHLTLKTFTIYDKAKIVTVPMPVEKIAILNLACAEAIRCVKATDTVIGIGTSMVEGSNKDFFPELGNLRTVGKWSEPDIEAILSLKPDIVIADLRTPDTEKLEDKLEGSGIAVIRMGFTYPDYSLAEMTALGYILGKKDEAKEFTDYAGKSIDLIETRISSIPEDKRPTVYPIYYTSSNLWKSGSNGSIVDMLCGLAGGVNIAHNLTGGTGGMYPTVDPEWVVKENPKMIFTWSSPGGYSISNDTQMKALWKSIVEAPELSQVSAAKDKKVYLMTTEVTSRPRWFVGLAYLAKWFNPDQLKDLDPEAMHKEYLEKFQGVEYKGTFVYPAT
ncbi:Cobalamin-binding protein [uncultured archaeon]|nr:Cobalamin-binding protein [uncultured archaeon]